MSDDEVMEHVRRPPLPWRRGPSLTECGLPTLGHPVITRDELITKVKAQGQRRAALSTCMTCLDTARRHPSWDEDPVRSISREVESHWRRNPATMSTFRCELVAIAVLVERHRAEFDELLEDQALIVPIDSNHRGGLA